MAVEVLKREDLKRLLLDVVTDDELVTLISHLEDARADLVARLIVAPADADAGLQALACDVSIRDFREELARRGA